MIASRFVLALFAVAALVAVAAAAKPEPLSKEAAKFLWDSWKIKHTKSYASTAEETLRFAIFRDNLEAIRAHNAEGHSFYLTMNEFGDLESKEFKRLYTGLDRAAPKVKADSVHEVPANFQAPASVDWRTAGAVTPVKNQGMCGSCWSFSTTGAMEGAYFIKAKTLVSFSEQQLVDCDRASGDQGCNGGLMDNAFGYIAQNGLESESDYPYRGVDGTCQYSASKIVTGSKIAGFTDVHSYNPVNSDALASAVAQQPVSVAVYAADIFWQFYGGGVFDHSTCKTDPNSLDHGVLAVGYDTDSKSGKQYWIVKNSWGAGWGNKGYIWLKKGDGINECGVLDQPSYPHF